MHATGEIPDKDCGGNCRGAKYARFCLVIPRFVASSVTQVSHSSKLIAWFAGFSQQFWKSYNDYLKPASQTVHTVARGEAAVTQAIHTAGIHYRVKFPLTKTWLNRCRSAMGTDLALHVRESRAAAEAINMVAKFRLFLDKNKISLTKEMQIARSTCSSGFFHSFIKSDNFFFRQIFLLYWEKISLRSVIQCFLWPSIILNQPY